ncbi:unnamed protein product [Brachionus calyciflorus]|uniref:Peptidase M3A/M3B catalytic domain-containing protein n=1 Tax=Brachionus calyciflorus TaxID=104777 RepID=A0A814IF25_9BILA|nr:unnamed protein product [Brachionus calyciflorus]
MDTPSKIMEFLDQCSKTIEQKSLEDLDQMRQFKKKYLNSSQPLSQWDVPIIISRMKKNTFDLDRTHYLNYFSLGTVMEGLNMILNNVFKVNLEIENLNQEESWHSDIYKLAVKDSNNTLLGYIYCDFYNRNDKFSNVDCHFTIQCSKLLADKSYQIPIVVLHLNFPLPSPNRPTLLSFEMMENLFHEFGHAMHSMFAKTRYQHVSGTRCSTDFAEVPSQLMEFYCRDPRVLKQIAKHYITQEPLDDKTIHKLCKSKKMFASSELQNQILNSVLDQVFHLNELENSKTIDLIEKYTNKYHCLGYVKNTNWHLRYTHLVGYGAKYYSYLVSKALATKIWAECFEKDPLNSNAGEMYRQKLLQFGGEKRPEELINSLIGLDIHSSSLVDSLTNNI